MDVSTSLGNREVMHRDKMARREKTEADRRWRGKRVWRLQGVTGQLSRKRGGK